MYRDLGFLRVWGTLADGPDDVGGTGGAPYAYLIYPHRPILAYLAQTHRLLNEYCVTFPDETRPYGSSRLPDSDDVLAKWMALTGDERRLSLAPRTCTCPAGSSTRPRCGATCGACRSGSARGCATRRAPAEPHRRIPAIATRPRSASRLEKASHRTFLDRPGCATG